MAEKQLAIIDPDDKDTCVYCKETVQIHAISMTKWDSLTNDISVYPLKDCSLLDDTSIECKLRLSYSYITKKYHFEIEFTTAVPRTYQYEISLYYFDKFNKLKFCNVLNAENIRQYNTFSLVCSNAFMPDDAETFVNKILCSKICRKDTLYVLQQKPALLHVSQITDCSLLFENMALSNLTISVENRKFQVHKDILAAKSSVFLAMFETEMKEKRENHVKIEDMEANIFQEFLRYIYTNTVNDLHTHAAKLYVAADKYDLPKLKSICIDELSRSLNIDNVVHILLFADDNNVTILKEITIDFIKKHMKLIFQTEGYKALYESPKAYLIHEIFQATFDYVDTFK